MSDQQPLDTCGCCEGERVLTPQEIFNRPGLSSLTYRSGTYGSFLETMLARLGQIRILPDPGAPAPDNAPGVSAPGILRPLDGLRTRAQDDPAIALLDAWAVLADVLTFYTERIANEGYLRTALERRSLVELARLVGYRPRPGLAASVYLAFTLDASSPPVTIPVGTKAQSTPEQTADGSGALPQTFETLEAAEARPTWNAILPRLTQPQYILKETLRPDTSIYVSSPKPALQVNDPILLEFAPVSNVDEITRGLYRVLDTPLAALKPVSPADTACVSLLPWEDGLPAQVFSSPSAVYWNVIDYYRTSAQPYASSSTAHQIVEVLNGPGVEWITIDEVVRDGMVQFTCHNFPTKGKSWLGKLGVPGASAAEMIDVTHFEFGESGNQTISADIPNPLKGNDELELRVEGQEGERPAPIRFLNQTGFALEKAPGSEATALNEKIEQMNAARNGLDGRYNRFVELIDAASSELDMLERAYSINPTKIEIQRMDGDPTDRMEQAILAYLRAIQKVTALIGDLDCTPRLKPLLEPFLDTAAQALQNQIDKFGSTPSAQLAQARKSSFSGVLAAVRAAPAFQPANARRLARSTQVLFGAASDLGPRMLARVTPRAGQLYTAWASGVVPRVYTRPGAQVLKKAYVMRVKAGVFGQQMAGKPIFGKVDAGGGDKITQITGYSPFEFSDIWPDIGSTSTSTLYLEREYDKIVPGSWMVIQRYDSFEYRQVTAVATRTLSAFGISVPVTALSFDQPWTFMADGESAENQTRTLRSLRVYAQSEPLTLADEPVRLDVTGGMVELDGLYEGLQSGKWVIVQGERTDLPGSAKVMGAELVMIANVMQDVQMVDEDTPLPNDRPHTFLQLAGSGLAYRYRRGAVKVYANVVKATHGETHQQVLGSGDAGHIFQSFELRFKPLTYLPAPNAEEVQSALQVQVNKLLWHEAPNLAALSPSGRQYLIRIDDDGKTSVVFGDGKHGARLPTGPENISATYRNGLGKAGNVKGGQINLLLSRPPGVKDVINPLQASGGADREGPDGIRRNAPLALKALDRLVSVRDYEDFCRIFAGIGKAQAIEIAGTGGYLVHVTIAGDADIPIDPSDELYRNLMEALRGQGDPHQPFQIALRERILPVISAKVCLQPDYAWEFVEPQVRAALLDLLSFEQRELGEDITSSEVIAAIQGVPGVLYTDLDVLDRVDQARLENFLSQQGEQAGANPLDLASSLNLKLQKRIPVWLARKDPTSPLTILPAQIAYLDEDIRDLLILKEMPV